MDKLTKYRESIKKFLKNYVNFSATEPGLVEV